MTNDTSTMAGETVIRVAIVGGGIGGLAAAIALRQLSSQLAASSRVRLDVQVYEAGSHHSTVGEAITVGPNGLKTLEKIGAKNVLEECHSWRSPINAGATIRFVSFLFFLFWLYKRT